MSNKRQVATKPGQPQAAQARRPRAASPPKEREIVLNMKEDGAMREAGGSKYGVFNQYLTNSVMRTMWVVGGQDQAVRETLERKVMGAAYAALTAFKPQDEIEGMLAAQAVALHHASMEALRRSIISEQGPETASKLRRDATNLARGMTDMLAALAKHRGQGQQKVVVEHVHVHAGGQAVVGAVSTGGALPTHGGAVPTLTQEDVVTAADIAAVVTMDTGEGEGL